MIMHANSLKEIHIDTFIYIDTYIHTYMHTYLHTHIYIQCGPIFNKYEYVININLAYIYLYLYAPALVLNKSYWYKNDISLSKFMLQKSKRKSCYME